MDRQPDPHTSLLDLKVELLGDAPRDDERLLLLALARWREGRQHWLELMADAPAIRGGLTPTQWLERLEPLGLQDWLSQRWDTWWDGRAPGTEVSRWQRAIQLFRDHFDAVTQHALAQGQSATESLKSLQAMVNDGMPESPSPPAIEGAPDPLEAALSRWRVQGIEGQLQRLRLIQEDDTAGQATQALDDAEAWQRRRTQALFAAPPDVAASVTEDEDDDALTPIFASPMTWRERRMALQRQNLAIEALLDGAEGVPDASRLAPLQQSLDALVRAEESARTAAVALLDRRPALRMVELRQRPNAHYDALYQARLAGLRAEASVQRLLQQISDEEHGWLQAVLDNPKRADRTLAVACLSLSLSETAEDGADAYQTLDGPLVIRHEIQTHSLLLYWPGRGGGLQRFESSEELERAVFKLHALGDGLALHLSPVSGDPFEYSLQNQLYTCEMRVTRLLTDYPVPAKAQQQRIELEKCVLETADALGVPVDEAREQAYADILEQQQTHTLAGQLPEWLARSADSERARLKVSINAFIVAMKNAHALVERDLPHRDDFGHKRVEECLRRDFSLKQAFSVTLDLPDSTTWQKTLMEGAAPGTPQKNILIASAERGQWSIAQLANLNIDQSLWWRMTFIKVEVSADSAAERATLVEGLTASYLRTLVTELDLAGHYETLIVRAFMGSTSATAYSNEYRRECLVEPFRLMLKLRSDTALLQKQLDQQGWQILDTAIDANSAQAFAANGRRIVLRPACLTVGGDDTQDGETGLSGVTLIEEQVSGVTLLYLPDSPDGRFFYQCATLALARERLFILCLRPEMVDYLAGRALIGDHARHVSRINQARQRNFDALISAGTPWPATTSLAAHLLNAHMGRLIEAHRATSRSNTALELERYALAGGVMFNYLKMALGMVPFVGGAIALYDAWDSANLATVALLRGDVGHGLAQLESVLLSLIDAAMDVLPSVSAGPSLARALTRQRQAAALLRGAPTFHRSSLRRARRRMDRFEGYEYEGAISLTGLQPVSDGLYRNVYRHRLGDFIIREGRVYQVKLQDRTLRLFGTRRRAYQQPIALDDAGHWDTYFAVHGTLYALGLPGGGNVAGHLADGLDTIWPASLRRWLPHWLTDRAARHQRRLENTIDALSQQIGPEHQKHNEAIRRYHASDEAAQRLTRDAVDKGCSGDIDLATQRYSRAIELLPLSRGNRRQKVQEVLSQSAMMVVERNLHRADLKRDRCLNALDDISVLAEQMRALPDDSLRATLQLSRQIRVLRQRLIADLAAIDVHLEQLNLWRRRISLRAHKASVSHDLERMDSQLSEATRDYVKALNHLPMLTHFDRFADPSWAYLHERMGLARVKVFDALNTQNSLPDVVANVSQRHRVLTECLAVYEQFSRDLKVWTAGYGQHFDAAWIAPTLEYLNAMSRHARNGLRHGIRQGERARRSGEEIFETEGNHLLIGRKEVDPVTRQIRYTMNGEDGQVENWLPASAGKYRRQVPPSAVQPDLRVDGQVLLAEARQRLAALDDYRLRVDGYARQEMLPADLEYMLTSEAAELRLRARRITRVNVNEPIIAQLNAKAQALIQEGRDLRVAQTLKSRTPTEGYLDYLHQAATQGQPIIEIRKVGTRVDLGRRADGQPNFLQEFEVLDVTGAAPRVLWYAHFHYASADPVFSRFEKAHLKIPEQRNQGLKWQQRQADSGAAVDPIWRGPLGQPLAIKYFEALF